MGYATIISLLAFVWLVEEQIAAEKARAFILAFLTTSPAFLWEVAVRSTLFGNVVLVLLYSYFAERLRQQCSKRRATLLGLCGGLVLSTPGVFVLPLATAFFSLFVRSRNWLKGTLYALALLIGFVATLLPFAVRDWNAFRACNPIMLEQSFVPYPVLILLVLWSVFGGMQSTSLREQYRCLGVILFCTVSVSLIKFVILFGWEQSFWQSRFDISYYMLALPYLLLALTRDDKQPQAVDTAKGSRIPFFSISCAISDTLNQIQGMNCDEPNPLNNQSV